MARTRKTRKSKRTNNILTAPRSAAVNRSLVKKVLSRWKTQRKAKITLPPFPALSIDRVPSRRKTKTLKQRLRLERNLYTIGLTDRGHKTKQFKKHKIVGGLGASRPPSKKNAQLVALNSARNEEPKPENQSSKKKTRDVCKQRPDSKKAQKGKGGSKSFVPWCK